MVEERRFLNKQDKGLFIPCIANGRHHYCLHYSTSSYLRMWRGPENISTAMRGCKKDFDLKKPESVSLPQLSSEITHYITNLEQAAQKNAKCQGQIVYIKLGMMMYSHNPSTSEIPVLWRLRNYLKFTVGWCYQEWSNLPKAKGRICS